MVGSPGSAYTSRRRYYPLMRNLIKKVAVVFAVLTLGGCATHARPAASKHCTAADYALSCGGLPPVSPTAPPSSVRVFAHGVDFAWGAPSVAQMRWLGASFGASYFSHDPSKGWVQRAGLA